MCFDPVSLAAIGTAVSSAASAAAPYATAAALAGGVVSGVGAIQSGRAQAAQAEYSAKVSEENAKLERMKGAAEAEAIDAKYDRLRASQITQATASGADPTYGSASLIINQETGKNRALDTMSTLWNANSAALSMENEAKGQRMAGKNARKASYFEAGGSFLNGLSQLRKQGGIA